MAPDAGETVWLGEVPLESTSPLVVRPEIVPLSVREFEPEEFKLQFTPQAGPESPNKDFTIERFIKSLLAGSQEFFALELQFGRKEMRNRKKINLEI